MRDTVLGMRLQLGMVWTTEEVAWGWVLVHLVQGQMVGMYRGNIVTPVTLDWLGRHPEYHCEELRTVAAVHSE